MRRLDCVLESKKDEVITLYNKYKNDLEDVDPVILNEIGLPFFNASAFDLSRLKGDPTNVLINLKIISRDILSMFKISSTISIFFH